MNMIRTTPEKIVETPARKNLIQNCLIAFSMYKKDFPYWPNWRLMAHTQPDSRLSLMRALNEEALEEAEKEKEVSND